MSGPGTDSENEGRAEAFGWKFNAAILSVWLVATVTVYVLLFVLPVHPMYSPGGRLWYIYLGMAIATACLIYLDADSLGTKLDVPGFPRLRPMHWFLLVFLAWPIGYPLYFLLRSQAGQLLLVRIALGVAAAALLSMLLAMIVISSRSRSIYGAGGSWGTEMKVHGQTIPKGGKGELLLVTTGAQVIRLK